MLQNPHNVSYKISITYVIKNKTEIKNSHEARCIQPNKPHFCNLTHHKVTPPRTPYEAANVAVGSLSVRHTAAYLALARVIFGS